MEGHKFMRLTTKGRFAVTAMLDLALHQSEGSTAPVALAEISERQDISQAYLEQLFNKLRRHKIVESVRGPGGGYHLGRAAKEVSIADIILAVNESIDATQCGGKENCHGNHRSGRVRCMTHNLWATLNDKMVGYLESVSLQDLVNEQTSTEQNKITLHLD